MLRYGFVADGLVKMLVAVAVGVFTSELADFFLAPAWLVVTGEVLLFLSGATEISYGVRTGERSHLKVLVIFDTAWILAAALGIGLALIGSAGAGWVLFGFLALGSLAVAIVFTTGANGPDFGAEG